MSTVSRICPRCRIRILNHGSLSPASALRSRRPGQRSLMSAGRQPLGFQSRKFSEKSSDTPDKATNAPEDDRQSKEEEYPLADPVRVKLNASRLDLDKPEWRRPKRLTTTDVQRFLAKVKKVESKDASDVLPFSIKDASKVDKTYEMLLAPLPGHASGRRLPGRAPVREPIDPSELPPVLREAQSKFKFPRATHTVGEISDRHENLDVTIHGFIKSVRKSNRKTTFLMLYDFLSGPENAIQLVSTIEDDCTEEEKAAHTALLKLPPFVPVAIQGVVVAPNLPPAPEGLGEKDWKGSKPENKPEIRLKSLKQLNSVSPLTYTPETIFPPEKRHLQLRTYEPLRRALRMRDDVSARARYFLRRNGFMEVETPLLFKSTPEGAREFLVPTRSKENGGGMCYALPQSPQQYKQILMASGVARYFQFAKCFRDEDLRADRQPEFTQLDLEMSFARQTDVVDVIQRLIRELFLGVLEVDVPYNFNKMTYYEAMRSYGIDKPDLRFAKLKIHRVPYRHTRKGIQMVDTFYIRKGRQSPEVMKKLQQEFLAEHQCEGPDAFMSYIAGEDTANGVPEHGLSAQEVENINDHLELYDGDMVIMVNYKPGRLSGGSTRLGRLRQALINKAVEAGVLDVPKVFAFTWIVDFPLFSPVDESEPGQSGTAGLASTHHPFTAPHEDDIDLLFTEPHRVRAEHYDIVVNGIELGGGSRRIHDPDLQRYILEEVIKVHPDKLHQFDHLLEVLASGCPPHAGIALGFDRLLAVMMGTDSVKDVIAFPKNSKGVDPLVKSPSLASNEALKTYWLQKIPSHETAAETASETAAETASETATKE